VWSTSDPVSRLGLAIAIILVAAKVGADLASRLGQPSVLGELVVGVVLGNLPVAFLRELRTDQQLDVLARIGLLVLLFEVGLELTLREVMQVGVASARVAIAGFLGTLACGWMAARLAIPRSGPLLALFVAAALTATSIGISARVLKDTGATRTTEARTILGAAVLDDVLGLVILALMSSAVVDAAAHRIGVWSVARLAIETLALLALALVVGVRVSPWIFRASVRLRAEGVLLAIGLSFCFLFAWAADVIGLAPIVGALAAGLILEDSHSYPFVRRGERSLGESMAPISWWLVPIFFVVTGMRADLRAFGDPGTLLLIAALTAAAVLGKLACAAAAPRGSDRLAVALGMMPRGEVSLAFANLGASLHVRGQPLLDTREYSALVTVVLLTTLATPPALRARLRPIGHGARSQSDAR
jgi:Kef-type K+ transport system membrane component KefB